MFAYIDGCGWIDYVAVLVLGVWIGRRWAGAKLEAQCAARNCQTIVTMRTEKMKLAADKLKTEQIFDFMRKQISEKDLEIHGLKSVKGKMAQEIQNLTYQMPQPKRRLVA